MSTFPISVDVALNLWWAVICLSGLGFLGRNPLYGPGNVNVNAGIFKQFRFRERHIIQFRTELFHVFSHTNVGTPNRTVASANFGRIPSSGQAGIVQVALKDSF